MQSNSLLTIRRAVWPAAPCLVVLSALCAGQASVRQGQIDGHGPARSPWPKMLGDAHNTGALTSAPSAPGQPWLFEDLGVDRHVAGPPALDADGTLYIGADALYALDGATGAKRWGRRGGNLFAWPAIVGFDHAVYVSEYYDYCALDGKTGAVRWRFAAHKEAPNPAGAGVQNSFYGFQTAGALSADGSLYLTSLEGNLYCLDSANGKELWHIATGNQIYGSPSIGRDGMIYFTGPEGLYAVDGTTGAKMWTVAHCSVFGPPALGDDGTVYVKTAKPLDGPVDQEVALTAFDGRNGERIWDFPMGPGDAASPAIGRDGRVYIGHTDTWLGPSHGHVYAVDGKTGVKRWSFETKGGVFLAPAIGTDGTVYIGSKGGVMYALDGESGACKWQTDIGSEIGTPAAVGANGLVYFGAHDGTVYAVRASDGARAPRPK